MRAFTYSIVLSLLSGTLAAQIPQISPAVTKFSAATSTTAVFSPPTFAPLGPVAMGFALSTASTTLNQIELRRISGNAYRVAVASTGVPASRGGVGGRDVCEGVFDAAGNLVAMSSLAAAFNTAGNEDTFSISEDGRVAVSSGVATTWSSRSGIGVVWPTPQPVTGIAGTVRDAKLYTSGTQRKLAWRDAAGPGGFGGNVWSGDFNNGVVSNAAILMDRTLGRLGLNSPHPITEEIPSGSGSYVVHGWIVGRTWNAQDSDSFFVPGANPSVTTTSPPRPLAVWDDTRRQHNGTTLGASGTNFWVWDQALDPVCITTVALTGSNFSAAAGGPVHLRAMVPWSNTDTWLAAVFLGAAISPLPLPGTIGNPLGQTGPTVPLGMLGVSPIVTLQAPVSVANPGGVTFSFAVGAGSLPANVPIPMQVVGVNLTAGKIYVGNTAAIEGF